MGGKSNPIEDVLWTAKKAVDDTVGELDRITSGKGVHLDPLVKQKQEAKDAAKKEAADRAAALAKQKADAESALRTKVANEQAMKGGTIILGSKSKKGKNSGVSSGMGLSKGDTGLQV